MHRHSTDLVGLLFGIAFTIAGAGFLLHETIGTGIDPAWMTGLGLMLLGAVALVATLGRDAARHRTERVPQEPGPAPEDDGSDG